jgi:hypothetical protein
MGAPNAVFHVPIKVTVNAEGVVTVDRLPDAEAWPRSPVDRRLTGSD